MEKAVILFYLGLAAAVCGTVGLVSKKTKTLSPIIVNHQLLVKRQRKKIDISNKHE